MYVVIENTPGYLPDEEPAEFVDYGEAVEFLNERAETYAQDPDGDFTVNYGVASCDNLAAIYITDNNKTHDLGRWIAIERVEEEPSDIEIYGAGV